MWATALTLASPFMSQRVLKHALLQEAIRVVNSLLGLTRSRLIHERAARAPSEGYCSRLSGEQALSGRGC